MVKFGKKFFFNENETPSKVEKKKKVKKTNRKTIPLLYERLKYTVKRFLPLILILILIIIILLSISIVKNNKSKKKTTDPNTNESVVIDTVRVDVNTKVPDISNFVNNYEENKSDNDSIIYEDKNFVDNAYTNVGEYKVTIILSGKEYQSRLIVVDKTAPVVELQDVTITEGEYYTINQFIKSCEDNSKKDCAYDYSDSKYGKYTETGTYDIKIIASDLSGNKAEEQTAKLVIAPKIIPNNNPSNQGNNGTNTTKCEYGSTETTSTNPITYSLLKDGCPISFSYAKTGTYITIPEKMIKDDLEVLKKDIERLNNVNAEIQFEVNVTPVINVEKTGLLGYTSGIKAYKIISKDNLELVVDYYLNSNGKRVYQVNKLGLR